MAAQPTDRRKLIEAVRAVGRYGGIAQAARALGIPRTTLEHRIDSARMAGIKPDAKMPKEGPERGELDTLRDRILELESSLKSVRAETLTDQYVKRKIIGLKESVDAVTPPAWTVAMPRGKARPGCPVALWSDWHWGEVVAPSEIGGVNAFDLEIARTRAKRLVERTIYLLRSHVVSPVYEGIVVALGGDMLSGDIHEELVETNDAPLMPCLLDVFGVLRWAIGTMADEFGAVHLPCVPGNHGRTTRKPRAKQRAFTNFDWLLYRFLQESFAKDKRITFQIPDGPDALFRVYNTRFLLTHGDQFRGGDGIIGPIGPLVRGNQKKTSRNLAVKQPYDIMLCGHWHQELDTARLMSNGSLKGYDEYAAVSNFSFELPRQRLFLTHPERGVTMKMSVHLEEPGEVDKAAPWVSLRDAA